MQEVTQILEEAKKGDRKSASQLLPIVYNELRRVASSYVNREEAGLTISATALVHEVFLRLTKNGDELAWDSQRHFFSAASISMRRILIEVARRKKRTRHGGDHVRVCITSDSLADDCPVEELLALDAALNEFSIHYPVAADLVNLRFFSGLSMVEASAILGISKSTAQRHWTFSKAWLAEYMGQ